jgi:hypothetical protein
MNKESHIFPLPEINDIIIRLLDGESFIAFCLTCKSAYIQGNDWELWKNIICKENIYYDDKPINSFEEKCEYYKFRDYNKYTTDYTKIKNAIQIKNNIIHKQKNNDTLHYSYILINVYDNMFYQNLYYIINDYFPEDNNVFGYYDEFILKYNEEEYYLFLNHNNHGFFAKTFMKEDDTEQVDNRIKISKFIFELILTFIIIDDNYDSIVNHDYNSLI